MRVFIDVIDNNKCYVVGFNGGELKTKRRFVDRLWDAFSIPYEKQYSLDALNDYMRDLSWIQMKNFKIIINNYSNFIKKKGNELDFAIESLNFFEKYWKGKGHEFIIILR